MKFILVCLILTLKVTFTMQSQNFVSVDEGKFVLKNKEYVYVGANYWQGMNLGAPKSGDRNRLIRELDEMQALGIKNLRIVAATEADDDMRYAITPALQVAPGVYNNDLWKGLDFLLSEMGKRNMKAVMVLGNFWTWSGGFPQYLKWANAGSIPFPQDTHVSWDEFTSYSQLFYTNKIAQQMMNNHIKEVINRKNSITKEIYKNDTTIMSWQLANEPRGYNAPEAFLEWTKKTASFIKSLDTNHLVCLGTEGNTDKASAGTEVFRDNNNNDIDYITMHIWVQNWGWYSPTQNETMYTKAIEKVNNYWNTHIAAAKKLNKPIILEEFGIARDKSSYQPTATTKSRDRFYKFLFGKVSNSIANGGVVKGLNFWTYTGEGRPAKSGEYWSKGDPIIGDPAHELQGWYSIYNSDYTTLKIIKNFAFKINNFQEKK